MLREKFIALNSYSKKELSSFNFNYLSFYLKKLEKEEMEPKVADSVCPLCTPPPISGAHCHAGWQPPCCQRGLTWFWNSVEMPHGWNIVENNSGLNLGGKQSVRANNTAAWGCDTGWASKKSTSHLTGDLLNETAVWALISFSVFLGIWNCKNAKERPERTPVIYSSLAEHEARKCEPEHTCKLPHYSMCASSYRQIPLAKGGGSLTGSRWLSITSDQSLSKHKLFWPNISYSLEAKL